MKVWQIYYDKISKSNLDPKFIPYDNTGRCDNYFENSVILDIWKNKRNEWENEDYVGVLSWRFKEKTGLTYDKIKSQLDGKDAYLLTPPSYFNFKSPISSIGFISVREVAKLADQERVLPFNLFEYDNEDCINFCNFFIVKPHIFNDYCRNYLNRIVQWMTVKKSRQLKKQLKKTCTHREGKQYPTETFVLEALFQCYIHYNKIEYSYLFDKETKGRIDRHRRETVEFAKLLMS